MKLGTWVGILALVGAVIGYVVFRTTGCLRTATGAVLGIITGAVLYAVQACKTS